MKISVQELLDRGYIEDITTERQRKRGTSQYRESVNKAVPHVGNVIGFAIYRDDKGNITHYRNFTSNPKTIKTKEQFERLLYKVVASNYFMQVRVYEYSNGEVVINVCPPITTNKIKEMIDSLTDQDLKERKEFLDKLVTLNKMYGGDKEHARRGPYRELIPTWAIPYQVWDNMEKPKWLKIIKTKC